jgi:hypothetical protein
VFLAYTIADTEAMVAKAKGLPMMFAGLRSAEADHSKAKIGVSSPSPSRSSVAVAVLFLSGKRGKEQGKEQGKVSVKADIAIFFKNQELTMLSAVQTHLPPSMVIPSDKAIVLWLPRSTHVSTVVPSKTNSALLSVQKDYSSARSVRSIRLAMSDFSTAWLVFIFLTVLVLLSSSPAIADCNGSVGDVDVTTMTEYLLAKT